MDHLMDSLKPGGWLTYFEYIATKHLKKPFVNKEERRRLNDVGQVTREFKTRYNAQKKHVLFNLPPATCHLIQKPHSRSKKTGSL